MHTWSRSHVCSVLEIKSAVSANPYLWTSGMMLLKKPYLKFVERKNQAQGDFPDFDFSKSKKCVLSYELTKFSRNIS